MIKLKSLILIFLFYINFSSLALLGSDACLKHFLDLANRKSNFILTPSNRIQKNPNYFSNSLNTNFLTVRLNNLMSTLGFYSDARLKAEKIFKKINFDNIHDKVEIKNFASKLTSALYGPPNVLDDYIFLNKSERIEKKALRQIRENLIYETLLSVYENHNNPNKPSWAKRLSIQEKKLRKHPLGQFFLTFPPPYWSEKKLPDALRSKILTDGYEKHEKEVNDFFKNEGFKNVYNTSKNLILAIAVGTFIAVHIPEETDKVNTNINHEKKIYRKNIEEDIEKYRTIENEVIIPVIAKKKRIIEKSYEEALEDFYKKWGEYPTEEEKKLLKKMVEEGIN